MAENLNIKVSITDTEVFKELLDLLKSIIDDDRIDTDVRQEYESQIVGFAERHGYYTESSQAERK